MLHGGLLFKGRGGGKYRDLRRKEEVMGDGPLDILFFFGGEGIIKYK